MTGVLCAMCILYDWYTVCAAWLVYCVYCMAGVLCVLYDWCTVWLVYCVYTV